MMQVLKETTKWDMNFQPNHIYLLDGSTVIAYIKAGTTEPFYFKSKWNLDKRYRTFEELKSNPFKTNIKSSEVKVVGSKGQTYYVDATAGTCTCKAFEFKGNCKHIQQVKESSCNTVKT